MSVSTTKPISKYEKRFGAFGTSTSWCEMMCDSKPGMGRLTRIGCPENIISFPAKKPVRKNQSKHKTLSHEQKNVVNLKNASNTFTSTFGYIASMRISI